MAEMFLWWSSTKIVEAVMSDLFKKHVPPGGRGLFSLYIFLEILKTD